MVLSGQSLDLLRSRPGCSTMLQKKNVNCVVALRQMLKGKTSDLNDE